ncbi:helix-turn-helix domain-containing protein [Falsiroseomonas oryzae]|uniref:helix-turn-helix domain-containing protein n=1 Tax=Falsiroseomonas oryzae TaxID=2766473 RepID=UPI0022EA81A7|nr:helix-turn-helix domain-containing protein [Roseomonas sp. MO-31]
MAPPASDRLLNHAEAAATVGRSTRTIRRWIRQGKLPAGGFGRAAFIRESDLLRALGFADEPPTVPAADTEKDEP